MGYLGAHISTSGGVENSPKRGRDIGCDTIQIFTKNQRQWKGSPLSEDSICLFRNYVKAYQIKQTVIHASYLINLASPDSVLLEKSRQAFLDELNRANVLNAAYLVLHPGAYTDSDLKSGIKRIAESLNACMEQMNSNTVTILLENTSGQGSSIGARFQELAEILIQLRDRHNVGVCMDTAHAFAAGYDIRSEKAYGETFHEFNRLIGLEFIKVFHLNDSKTHLGSRVDRHENIGLGRIGLQAFRILVNDSLFQNHPMILETPGGNRWFKKNIQLLNSMMIKRKK